MKNTLFIPLAFYACLSVAEPRTESYKPSCGGKGPINYTDFDQPEWRAVFSWHYDDNAQAWAHYVTENDFAHCDKSACYYYASESKGHTALHGISLTPQPETADALEVESTDEWSVMAVHKTLVPGIGEIVQSSAQGVCAL